MRMFAKYKLIPFVVLLGQGLACARPAASPAAAPIVAPADAVLRDASAEETLAARAARAPLTVLVFFGPDCPVQKAHDARLRELVAAYAPRGVSFAAVVTKRSGEVAAPSMPVLEDEKAALANALGVEYSTHSVVLDRERRVLYSGAIDGDRTHLTPGAEPYLRNALDDALAGRAVAKPRTEPLGCPLEKD